jgi:hypothetical protein
MILAVEASLSVWWRVGFIVFVVAWIATDAIIGKVREHAIESRPQLYDQDEG